MCIRKLFAGVNIEMIPNLKISFESLKSFRFINSAIFTIQYLNFDYK